MGTGWSPCWRRGFPDARSARASDALADRECFPQWRDGLAGVGVLEVTLADSFQSSGFLQRCADLAGDGERLIVVVKGLLGG